jgi:soluble lytic murein transglycosylase
MRFNSRILIVLVMALLPLSAHAGSLEQRLLFEIVYKQIGAKPGLLAIHTEALRNYPLFPYLQAAVYEKRLAEATSQTSAFIEQYKGAPFAEKLRQEWLNRLAKNDQGTTFLKVYIDNGNQTLRCHWMRFSLAVPAERRKVLEQFHAWWLSGKPIPKECGTVEVAWRTGYWPAHGAGMDDYWTRLDNAYRLKDKTMIAATRKLMPAGDKALLDLWQQLDKDPEKAANLSHFKGDSRKEWVVRAYGIDRLAWRDPEYAAEVFRDLERDARYPDDLHHRNYQTIALSLASSGSPKAADYLDSVPAGWVDERVATWRVMDAMRRQDYVAADRWMLQLSIDEAQAPRWRYLIGRSADLQGNRDMADILWRSLRKDYNYYGFLARARTGELAAMPSPVLEWSAATLLAVRQLPGMLRAAEWRALDDDQRARKEWYATARQLDEDGIKQRW